MDNDIKLEELPYKKLQALAKKFGVKATLKKVKLVCELQQKLKDIGLNFVEENENQSVLPESPCVAVSNENTSQSHSGTEMAKMTLLSSGHKRKRDTPDDSIATITTAENTPPTATTPTQNTLDGKFSQHAVCHTGSPLKSVKKWDTTADYFVTTATGDNTTNTATTPAPNTLDGKLNQNGLCHTVSPLKFVKGTPRSAKKSISVTEKFRRIHAKAESKMENLHTYMERKERERLKYTSVSTGSGRIMEPTSASRAAAAVTPKNVYKFTEGKFEGTKSQIPTLFHSTTSVGLRLQSSSVKVKMPANDEKKYKDQRIGFRLDPKKVRVNTKAKTSGLTNDQQKWLQRKRELRQKVHERYRK